MHHPPFFGSPDISVGRVADHFDELGSLGVPAHHSRHINLAPVLGVKRTLQKSIRHQVFADISCTHFIEGRVVARLESLAVLYEGLDACNEACVLQ